MAISDIMQWDMGYYELRMLSALSPDRDHSTLPSKVKATIDRIRMAAASASIEGYTHYYLLHGKDMPGMHTHRNTKSKSWLRFKKKHKEELAFLRRASVLYRFGS